MAFIPAYMRVRQYVVDLSMRHADADVRIMSEREICRKFGVSRTTARKALKDLIDEGWLTVKHGKGMFVDASRMRNNAARLRKHCKIMLLWGDGKNVTIEGFFLDILARMCDTLKYRPVMLQTANLIGTREQMCDEVKMYNPDGIIWVRPPREHASVLKKIRKMIPVCIVGNVPSSDPFHVTMDYRKAGRLAASWFLDRGKERAVFVGYEGGGVRGEVFRGWMDEFAARGKQYDPRMRVDLNGDITAMVCDALKSANGVFTFGSEFPAVDNALTQSSIRDIPLLADGDFFGIRDADDRPAAELVMFKPEAAVTAAEHLFRRLTEPAFAPEEVILDPEIVACAPAAARITEGVRS